VRLVKRGPKVIKLLNKDLQYYRTVYTGLIAICMRTTCLIYSVQQDTGNLLKKSGSLVFKHEKN
jgi:hypothetical protein